MRIIKSNKGYYKTFVDTLVESTPAYVDNNSSNDYYAKKMRDRDRRLSKFMSSLVEFDLKIHHSDSLDEIVSIVKQKLQSVITFKDLAFYYYDEGYDDFAPVTNGYSRAFGEIIEAIKKDTIFDPLIKQERMVLIPISESIKVREGVYNILFVPVKKWRTNRYFICLDTPLKKIDEESFESKALNIVLAHTVPIIENFHSRAKLNKVYKDFQLYQSKFFKDYRLAVIGELTLGMTEEIISPMQVILSSMEFLAEDRGNTDAELFETIERQIKKVKSVVKRLVKFSSLATSDITIRPVNLNEIIKDYVSVMNLSFKSQGFECITDLQKDIPAILSHRSYLNLLLSTIFTIIKEKSTEGGVIIQTKVNDQYVFIKVLTTNYVEEFVPNNVTDNAGLELLILENLVKKHEGKMMTKATPEEGSKLVIAFPIIRKVRK